MVVTKNKLDRNNTVVATADNNYVVGVVSVSLSRSGVTVTARPRRSATTETAALSRTWHGPVCAFDGRTHHNLCSLAKFNCRSGRDLPVEYIGSCQSQFSRHCK